uniref:C-type lectin domain-containing protein n=1 Tax=Lepeophtheirus salmonis TaxID=72036 RepID=A0A0K2U9C0_LEPSM
MILFILPCVFFFTSIEGIPLFPDSNIQYYGVCPINFFYYPKTGLCYYKDTFTDTYVNAKEICGRMFGNRKGIFLASIQDETLRRTFFENKRFFLGITDIKQEGHFVWENGKVFEGHYPWDDFLDCGYYSPETGWGLFTCDNKKRYLCQTKSTVHCDGDYFYYDKTSRCYKISNISVSYSAALDNCKNDISEHDTRAATISDPTLLQHILEHSDPFFVGISDREREGHFVDTNDEGYPHPPWYEDRRCKSYYYPHGWDRVNCNKEMRYICQSLREEKCKTLFNKYIMYIPGRAELFTDFCSEHITDNNDISNELRNNLFIHF